jgi:four helix bundle protein
MLELGTGNIIVDKTFSLALAIIDFCEELNSKGKRIVANQLLRSGTAVGALIAESQQAESKADFIHKAKIALKEANETYYWLKLCEMSVHMPFDIKILNECAEVIKILSKIIATSKQNTGNSKV